LGDICIELGSIEVLQVLHFYKKLFELLNFIMKYMANYHKEIIKLLYDLNIEYQIKKELMSLSYINS